MAKNKTTEGEEMNTRDVKQHTIQKKKDLTAKEEEALAGHRTGDYDVQPKSPQENIDEHWANPDNQK